MKRTAADARFSLQIRERDGFTCQRCHAVHLPNSKGLHCAHMYTRRIQATRFDEDNACALCYGCHQYLDSHPYEKLVFFRELLGVLKFDALSARAHGRRDRVRMIRWDDAAHPRTWTWTSPQERKARNIQIREWWALGHSAREIAERVDLTPQRIAQIVRGR